MSALRPTSAASAQLLVLARAPAAGMFMPLLTARCLSAASGSGKASGKAAAAAPVDNILVVTTKNGVATLSMNRPDKLNAWTRPMIEAIHGEFKRIAADDSVKVAVLTGTGKYYCAGVNLSETLKPMHPKELFQVCACACARMRAWLRCSW
jgi:hypothetical protein